ncbi:type I-E CRISPR-associated protein Cse1/CasA [Leptolyngbya iicbica]|uniref:Type I-E CRISPR-associated protein Cse1/CasA n=1 Tax=Lyngbya confervoides BDU141951 TaxID=1574623 RepID=A0A0C1URU3_9CYAN
MNFDLTTKPWVPVVTQDGLYREVSLLELFAQWETLRKLQADNPPTTLALHRFLLALLNWVYEGPEDEEDWERIRDDNGEEVITYLKDQKDCFDLLHPNRPFMQDPTLTVDVAGEIYQAYVLHGNNTSTVFCHEHQWSGDSLDIAAAARLVLRLHVFDVGGRKTGSSVSAGVIPTMDAANVLVRGNSLKETLLLNLMQYDGEEKPFEGNGEDLPAWEREPQPAQERVPTGYVDYLTFQWRRVRLFFEGGRAVKVAVHPGDRLPKSHSSADYEMAIAYKKNPKKPGDRYTIRLDLNRSLWRDSTAFLQSSGKWSDDWIGPKIITWIAELQQAKLVADWLNLQVLGLTVDNAKPLGWVSEQLSVPTAYVTEKPLWQALDSALQFAEKHKDVFMSFQGSPYYVLAEALNPPSTPKKAISQQAAQLASTLGGSSRYWAALDQEFKELLHEKLPNPNDKTVSGNGTIYGTQALQDWEKAVQSTAAKAFTKSISSIRNYQARAKALNSLNHHLDRLGSDKNKSGKGKKTKTKSKLTAR